MTSIADPMDSLRDLQRAIDANMDLKFGHILGDFFGRYELLPDHEKFVFAKIINGEVQSLATFGTSEPISGVPTYSVNYSVNEKFRRQGLATEAVIFGAGVMKSYMAPKGIDKFYIEAIIDIGNLPSIKLAEKLFPGPSIPVIDEYSDTKCVQFKKLISAR